MLLQKIWPLNDIFGKAVENVNPVCHSLIVDEYLKLTGAGSRVGQSDFCLEEGLWTGLQGQLGGR